MVVGGAGLWSDLRVWLSGIGGGGWKRRRRRKKRKRRRKTRRRKRRRRTGEEEGNRGREGICKKSNNPTLKGGECNTTMAI